MRQSGHLRDRPGQWSQFSQVHPFLTVILDKLLNSLGLSFLICKVGIIVPIVLGSLPIDLENVCEGPSMRMYVNGLAWILGSISCCDYIGAREGRWKGNIGAREGRWKET